jgi:membrane protease YdiL (CAAX protease family)
MSRRTPSEAGSSPAASGHPARLGPLLRVAAVQLVLVTGIVGNLVGWLTLALLVDRLGWLRIDFHGKTLRTIGPDGKVVGLVIVIAVNLGLVMLAWRWLERGRPRDMLWTATRGGARALAWGLVTGLGESLAVAGVIAATGLARFRWVLAPVSADAALRALGWLAASSVLAPVLEEALYRGYWFQNVRRGWGVPAAVVVTSLLFGGLHVFNPNSEPLGAVNIALSGAAYAVGMLRLGSLWFPIGWHAAWNFAQFFVFGSANSGIAPADLDLTGATLLTATATGPAWLTGGGFGIEASVVQTVVLLVMLAGLLAWRRPAGSAQP